MTDYCHVTVVNTADGVPSFLSICMLFSKKKRMRPTVFFVFLDDFLDLEPLMLIAQLPHTTPDKCFSASHKHVSRRQYKAA